MMGLSRKIFSLWPGHRQGTEHNEQMNGHTSYTEVLWLQSENLIKWGRKISLKKEWGGGKEMDTNAPKFKVWLHFRLKAHGSCVLIPSVWKDWPDPQPHFPFKPDETAPLEPCPISNKGHLSDMWAKWPPLTFSELQDWATWESMPSTVSMWSLKMMTIFSYVIPGMCNVWWFN